MKKCIHCEKELTGRKLKYCNDHCRYWYLVIKNDRPTKFKLAQHLRMQRVSKRQADGRVGVRFN